jgi:two-component system chemotaxis sensor kinase CheA
MSEDMDLSQFKEVFVSETKEHLSAMNANLLELEKKPGDTDLLNEIFRVAHTLKGMAATMGFDKITELSHNMEDVLDKLRKGKQAAGTDIIEVLFDCFDTLEGLLGEIVEDKDKGIPVRPLIERLKLLSSAPEGGPAKTTPVAAAEVVNEPSEPVQPAPAADEALAAENKPSARSEAGAMKSQTVRVKVEHLDKLINVVGELVIAKARLAQIAAKKNVPELAQVINEISQFTIELQGEVLKTRMVPVKTIFDRYPRMVRDISHKLNKEFEFVMTGTEIEIDRMLLDQINEPLVHLLRNACDHGIELPEERKKLGKPVAGRIQLNAKREKGYVWIEVSDDGKGMDPAEIKRKAVEKAVITADDAALITDTEALLLICSPQFSMAKQITDISGRGVGMDVVKNLVEVFNGKLEIRSKPGIGSTFIIQLPLSLAIIQALLVEVNKSTYAVSLTNVSEIIGMERGQIRTIDSKEVLLLRDEVIPMVFLSKVFGLGGEMQVADYLYAVIVDINNEKVGLVVDNLIGKQEIVIKTLVGMLRDTKYFSGATILGDGRVILILDAAAVAGVQL